MKPIAFVGLVLIVLSIISLVYGKMEPADQAALRTAQGPGADTLAQVTSGQGSSEPSRELYRTLGPIGLVLGIALVWVGARQSRSLVTRRPA